jgi:hypothetical protein
MKLILTVFWALVLLASPISAFASDVTCPLHPYAACYDTGRIAPQNPSAHMWHCSCGDDVWVQ